MKMTMTGAVSSDTDATLGDAATLRRVITASSLGTLF